MSDLTLRFIQLDLIMLATALLAALACALLGNFLILRRQALLGDAISHAVLPGLVIAFVLSGSRASLPMFIGAAVAGVGAALLIELLRRLAKLEYGASMAVVFTIFFALGVLVLERMHASGIDLDTDCVLMGQLEVIALPWFDAAPRSWAGLFTTQALAAVPRQTWTLAIVLVTSTIFIALFYKELRLSSFDPDMSTMLGFNASIMHAMLMLMVAAAVVASFEAAGSILVIAMLVCPPATARMLTDRLHAQIALSLIAATATAILGYVLAAFGPRWAGLDGAVSIAGMMAVVSGLLLALAIVLSPTHGALARLLRQVRHDVRIAREDLLAMLFRAEELEEPSLPRRAARAVAGPIISRLALGRALRRAEINRRRARLALTDTGRDTARSVVRSHRLWEAWLVDNLGLRADHVHEPATRLEHLRRRGQRLAPPREDRTLDPHQRPIPPSAGP